MSVPAVNFAKRLHQKYKLSLPVDLISIANRHAVLKYTSIPLDIDGISTFLKVSGKKPVIFINGDKPSSRQRFTLAHEIGHVVIPWHTGTIFDIADPSPLDSTLDYWTIEDEANMFATELLMPSDWVAELIAKNDNLARVNEHVASKAEVSPLAACFRIISLAKKGCIFAVLDSESTVTYSGRSQGTIAGAPQRGETINISEAYSYAESIHSFDAGQSTYFWIKTPSKIKLPHADEKDWRQIMTSILNDVGYDESEKGVVKQRINGVFGFANGLATRSECDKDSIYSACVQRFKTKDDLRRIVAHDLFPKYLSARINDLLERKPSA